MSSAPPPPAITNFRYARLRDLVIAHEHWVNPRTVTGMDSAEILDLARDIKVRNIQVPLVVQKIYAGKNKDRVVDLVLEGQRRVLACEEVFDKDAEIPVVDRTIEPIELTEEAADKLMLDMLSVASRREGLSGYELSEVAERLRGRKRTLADIGKAIGRDESWVSKILTARSKADPKLMHRWRKGQITEEQFKALAVLDHEQQVEVAALAVKAREGGDAAEARAITKELAEKFKQDQKKTANGHAKPSAATKPQAVKGAQADMFDKDKKPDKPEGPPPTKIVIKPIVLEEMIAMADKRPPTADYVKGVMDCARFLTGEIDMSDFSKAWHQYVSRVEGRPAKKRKPAKKKTATKAKAKKAKRK